MLRIKAHFLSATDADSEGVEGKFLFGATQNKQLLQPEQLQLAEQVYGVTKQGNFGVTISFTCHNLSTLRRPITGNPVSY